MKLIPKFTVTPIEKDRKFRAKTYKVVSSEHDEAVKSLESEDTFTTGGFLVTFPNGNSIRVESETQLERLGLNVNGGMVDADSGEEVPIDASGNVDFRIMLARTHSKNTEKGNEEADLFADLPEKAEA